MNTDDLCRPVRCRGETHDRQSRRVACEHGRFWYHGFRLPRDQCLDFALLKYGLDDEIASSEIRVGNCGFDARKNGIRLFPRGYTLLDVLRQKANRMLLSALGEFL